MKKTNLLVALSIGILASSSGIIQVGAALYTFSVDFSTKEVANFTDYKQTFNSDTYNLDALITFDWRGTYRLDTCPTAFTIDMSWRIEYRINATGSAIALPGSPFTLPDFPCTTTNTLYQATHTTELPGNLIDAIVDDDANYVQFYSEMRFGGSSASNGRTLYLENYTNSFNLTYDFNTTYLFNYFLSDQKYNLRETLGTWTFNTSEQTLLQYLYTTAGNDEYRVVNSDFLGDIGTLRKKYAVDYNQEFFRGESVGASFFNGYSGGTDQVILSTSNRYLRWNYFYYYLNTANEAQAIVDAPIFNFTYEDCGSFLALNVGCFINNGLAYITNDAPIISDAVTLLNAGIGLAAQTFGIIGNFADDNIFGFLILIGFGFIAVKWLMKND